MWGGPAAPVDASIERWMASSVQRTGAGTDQSTTSINQNTYESPIMTVRAWHEAARRAAAAMERYLRMIGGWLLEGGAWFRVEAVKAG